MAVFVVCLMLFLGMTGLSSATYCICNNGVSDSVLQKNIDYACGDGADCTPILQNGPCFNPNTVKDHCNYAVNSYFQRKGQAAGSCDFKGTASISQNLPTGQSSGCVYPSSASNSGTTSSTTTGPNTNTSTTTTTGSTTPAFGLGPTASGGISNPDNSAAVTLHQSINLIYFFLPTLLFSGFICLRV